MKTTDQGKLAEDKACQFLQKKGLKLIQKNYRCRTGEIDLIMQDQEEIVFVEVRYRTTKEYGSALDTVDHYKIKKIISAASHYVSTKNTNLPMRFDVIGFDSSLTPKWVSNAFPAF